MFINNVYNKINPSFMSEKLSFLACIKCRVMKTIRTFHTGCAWKKKVRYITTRGLDTILTCT